MNEIGIKEVYDLQGGILAWKAKEYPVKKGDKEQVWGKAEHLDTYTGFAICGL